MSIQLWRKIEGEGREYYFTKEIDGKLWGVVATVLGEAAIRGGIYYGGHEVLELAYIHAWGPEDRDFYAYLWKHYKNIKLSEAPELLKIEKKNGCGNTVIQEIIQRLEE